MLIAAKKGKLRIHCDNHEKLVEDEITSTIFGPLRYFDPEDLWNLFKSFL